MQVKISQRGGDRNNHPIYEQAIRHFAKKLFHRSKHRHLRIKLIMAKNLHKKDFEGQHAGETEYRHTIFVDRHMPFHDIIRTIAHEMVHAKQVSNGELKYLTDSYMWKGVKYPGTIYDTTPDAKLHTIPWEAEPYGKENKLAKEFVESLFSR